MAKTINELFEMLRNGGQIYSSNDFTPEEIEKAQRMEHFGVDDEGFGFIYSPVNDRQIKQNMRDEMQGIRKVLLDAGFQPAVNVGCVQPPLSNLVSQLVDWNKQVERARDAFRDELLKKGYKDQDLRSLI